jgi:RNA polymerase sigma-70 factor (ECF subfamily)
MAEVAQSILTALDPETRRAVASELAAVIDAGLADVQRRWPDAPAVDDRFVAYVRDRVVKQPALAGALPRLRIDDLFLAWWAVTSSQGIAAFERAYADDLRRLVARFPRLDPSELTQALWIKLFVGSETAPPRVREFSGFGSLRSWFKVVATRSFLDATRAKQRERTDELDDDALVALVAADPDPRAAHQQAELQGALKRAFAAAVAQLTRRERAFLRHASVDGLTLDQIASTYQVHRATVARTLASARRQLHAGTRAAVIEALGIAPDELSSAVEQLDSQIDLSLSRIFGTTNG